MTTSKKTGSVFKTLLWFIALLVLGFMLFASINYIRAMFASAAFPADGNDTLPTVSLTGKAINSATSGVNAAQEDTEDQVDDVHIADSVFTVSGLTPEQVITGSEEITYRYSADNSITLAPTDNAELMKHGMGATTDQIVIISGVEATQSTGYSAKDGSKTVVLVIPVGDSNQEVLFVRGTERFLATVEAELVLNTQ